MADLARPDISGFILAGGSSSRLGQDKVLLPWKGQTLLGHAVARLQQVCIRVDVCASRSDLQPHLPQSVAIVHDAVPGSGPLGGMVPALEQSRTEWNFFLAVDLPLVPVGFLRRLADYAERIRYEERGTHCILPRVEGRAQPLCALYRQSLAPGMRRALETGTYKILLALQDAASDTVRENKQSAATKRPDSWIEFVDVEAFEAGPSSADGLKPSEWFLNVNTPGDLQRARDLARG